MLSTPVAKGSASRRVRTAITISSRAALPARSPSPLIVHSICLAPPATPAKELATARPRSSWQWVENTALSASGTRSRTVRNIASYSAGVEKPTVSGRLIVVAPARIAASVQRQR